MKQQLTPEQIYIRMIKKLRRTPGVKSPITAEYWPDRAYAEKFIPEGESLAIVETINGIPMVQYRTMRPVLIDLWFINFPEKDNPRITIEHDLNDGQPPVVITPGSEWITHSNYL
jgi:hypothetical protein